MTNFLNVLARWIIAVAAVTSCVLSVMNGRKLNVVHKNTHSLAQRNEEIARALGVTEGAQMEKAKRDIPS